MASVVVVGGGTMGLAAAWALAREGAAVTVLERRGHVHDFGSHSGFTRIIRHAYHEGGRYVPWVREADRLWCDLQTRRGEALLIRSGMIEWGPAEDPGWRAAVAASEEHAIPHEILTAQEAGRRYPFAIPDAWLVCHTPSGGYLRVGPCLDALRDEAIEAGAVVREGVHVLGFERSRGRLQIATNHGSVAADRVVLAAGAGLTALLPGAALQPVRRVMVWIAVDPSPALRELPVWGAHTLQGFFYGFPWTPDGIAGLKLGLHRTPHAIETEVDPDLVERALLPSDTEPLRVFAEHYFPAAAGPIAAHRVCLYTLTPSWDFLIDRHPDDPDIVVVGGGSGHGFKFAPALGRVVADMLLRDTPSPPGFAWPARPAGATTS